MKMYERIQAQCSLAQTYAEDGAYASAARVLREIASETQAHATRVAEEAYRMFPEEPAQS